MRQFPKRVKFDALLRADGRCEGCSALLVGTPQFDHVTPFGLGGDNSLENCQVLCRGCHNSKTGGQDVPQIAKADRQKAKAIGHKKKGRPMPGSRASPWKKKMDGTVERR